MIKDYVNEENLQVAMTEYDSEMDLDHVVKTQSGDQIGTVTQVFDNTHRSRRAGLCSCEKSQRKC